MKYHKIITRNRWYWNLLLGILVGAIGSCAINGLVNLIEPESVYLFTYIFMFVFVSTMASIFFINSNLITPIKLIKHNINKVK